MNVGDKVLVEATVTSVGADMVAVSIQSVQGVTHVRAKRSEVAECGAEAPVRTALSVFRKRK